MKRRTMAGEPVRDKPCQGGLSIGLGALPFSQNPLENILRMDRHGSFYAGLGIAANSLRSALPAALLLE